MRLTVDNHEQILSLFSQEKAGRLRDINARIRNEGNRCPITNNAVGGWRLTPGMSAANRDAAMLRANPNHIEGLDITGRGVDRRIIDLPDGAGAAMIALAREQFARGFGMSDARGQDGERQRLLMHSFLRDVPVADRSAALYTMQTIAREENTRLGNAVRQAVPNWIPGQRVPDEILRPILSGAGNNLNMTV